MSNQQEGQNGLKVVSVFTNFFHVLVFIFRKEYLKGRYRLQHAFVYYFDCAQKFIFKLVEIAIVRVGLKFKIRPMGCLAAP